jgi:nicotinamidase-related amidase
MMLDRRRSQLLIVDVQDKLAPHVVGGDAVIERCGRLVDVARLLDVPATVTEHYPKGLGGTAQALAQKLGNDVPVIEKIEFSGLRNPGIRDRVFDLRVNNRSQIVVAGMEAHVCVAQTCLDLLHTGFEVFLVGDAVSSRDPAARDAAIHRLEKAGGIVVHHEMVAFEWLERGDAPEFKDVLSIIK